MEWKASRRNVLKLAGVSTASGGLTARAFADGVERGFDATLWSFEGRLVSQLGLPGTVVASVLRRLEALRFQPELLVAPCSDCDAIVQDAIPFRTAWSMASDHQLPADFLIRSCALISRDAARAIRGPEVLFRCTAGCSYGGMTLFLLRSRGAQVALISNIAGVGLIRSLTFKKQIIPRQG